MRAIFAGAETEYTRNQHLPGERWYLRGGRALVVGALTLKLLTACSSDDSPAGVTPSGAPSAAALPSAEAPPSPDESKPSDIVCAWDNKDGKRQPFISHEPLTVRVDGRCDGDPEAPIGIYPQASQTGDSVDRVVTGESFIVQCVIADGGYIQDLQERGSKDWLWGETPRGKIGALPVAYAGFPDTSQIKGCD
jgi:hypothetical protein